MTEIIPIKDLRNTNEISEKVHATDEPIFVTRNGYGDLVIMSIETYDRLIKDQYINESIEESVERIEQGEPLYDAKQYVAELKGKYGEEI